MLLLIIKIVIFTEDIESYLLFLYIFLDLTIKIYSYRYFNFLIDADEYFLNVYSISNEKKTDKHKTFFF